METLRTEVIVRRLIAPLTIFTLTKLLDTRRVQKALEKVDSRAFIAQRHATDAVRKRVGNATRNPAILVAGAAAFILGIGLLTRSMKR
jgi:hypothetical protein